MVLPAVLSSMGGSAFNVQRSMAFGVALTFGRPIQEKAEHTEWWQDKEAPISKRWRWGRVYLQQGRDAFCLRIAGNVDFQLPDSTGGDLYD